MQIGYSVHSGHYLLAHNYYSVYVTIAAPPCLHLSFLKDCSHCCTPQENLPGIVLKLNGMFYLLLFAVVILKLFEPPREIEKKEGNRW